MVIARYILTDQRANMSPILFGTILFLKFNDNLVPQVQCGPLGSTDSSEGA